MQIIKFAAAIALMAGGIGLTPGAQARDHDRGRPGWSHHREMRHAPPRRVIRHRYKPRCHIVWRHHHRVRVCR